MSPVDFLRLRQQHRDRRQNLWHVKKNSPKTTRWCVFVIESCHIESIFVFSSCKAIVMASCAHRCQSSSSVLLLRPRDYIGAIEHFSPRENSTKETRRCPIILGRQHDYVKPSQCCREAIRIKEIYSKMTSRSVHGVLWRRPTLRS